MEKIIFTNTLGIPEEYAPKPASDCIPLWYKEMSSYVDGIKQPNGEGSTSATIKRCMPVFDSIVAGYILFTPVDVWVSQRDGQPWYEWPSFGPIQFHPIVQAPTHPSKGGHKISFPKWINSWAVKTNPGYSTLFVQPFHRESIFSILPAIVDTDKYDAPVNFPFVLNNIKYKGLIPAGTPIAQVIPFKRNFWEMEIGDSNNFNEQNKTTIKLRSKFFDGYRTFFRQNKEYK